MLSEFNINPTIERRLRERNCTSTMADEYFNSDKRSWSDNPFTLEPGKADHIPHPKYPLIKAQGVKPEFVGRIASQTLIKLC